MPSAFLRATKPAVASLPSRAASANGTCSPASASGARMRVPIRAPAAEKRVTASGSHWFSMGDTAPSMQSVMVNSWNTVTFALQRRLFQARATRMSPVDSSRARNGRIACSSCRSSSYVQAAGCAACGPSTTCAQRSA